MSPLSRESGDEGDGSDAVLALLVQTVEHGTGEVLGDVLAVVSTPPPGHHSGVSPGQ